jgi:hypothetical protein
MIEIHNHGPLVLSTNYWNAELARAGKLFVSVNAGAIRILLPPSRYPDLADMRAAKYCVLSRGPWPAEGHAEGVEIMFEDESQSPYCLHLTADSFDLLPAEPERGREWTLSAYTAKDGKPHRALDKLCHWRRVDKIPCMRAWII